MTHCQRNVKLIAVLSMGACACLGGTSQAARPMSYVVPSAWAQAGDETSRFDHHQLVKVRIQTVAQLEMMESLGAVVLNCVPGIGEMDFVIPPGIVARVRAGGMTARVVLDDVQPLIDASVNDMRAQAADIHGAGQGDGAPAATHWFLDYKTYTQVNDKLAELAALRPDLASVFTVGTSLEGRAIRGLRISSPGGPAVKPAVLFDGCQHAREWIAVMVPMFIAERLVNTYDSDPAVHAAVDHLEIFIIPIINVDGYEFTYAVNGNRLWRKNRRNHGSGVFGVDLNRNWGESWAGPHSTSSSPNSDLYYGTAPFSEPETAAMRDFMLAHPNLRGHIDFHSYGQLVLQPLGGQYAPPAAGIDLIDSLGTSMNKAIFSVHSMPYFNGWGGHLLYLASGVITDWCYSTRNILCYTVELRDHGETDFQLPAQQIIPTGQEHFRAALALAGRLIEGVHFDFPLGAPTAINSGATTIVPFDVHPITSGSLTPLGTRMQYRFGTSGPFFSVGAIDLGGDRHQVTIPAAACGRIIQYFFEADAQSGQVYRSPMDAPAGLHQAQAVSSILNFDFQTMAGWTTSANGAVNGFWQRDIPVASPNWPYDPPADADGSGQCFVTGNVDSVLGNADVDNGSVTLISPTLDLSNIPGSGSSAVGGGAVIAYSWFLHLASVGNDSLVVEINSSDGAGTWTEIARHTDNTGQQWLQHSVRQSQLQALNVPLTSTMKIRFTVSDGAPDSIVECGIDTVKILTACAGPMACLTDIAPPGGNNAVNIDDLVTVIMNWGDTSGQADVNLDNVVNIDDLVAVITSWGACQ